MARFLFVVKYREDSGGKCAYDGTPHCYGGLYNSAAFVVEMLNSIGIWARLVQVCDNNGIDAAVARYKPTVVIIEALWVVPEKFTVLHRLHPKVRWVVRIHSEIPFLAYEGIAMEWLIAYLALPQVAIASNSKAAVKDLEHIAAAAYLDFTDDEIRAKVKYLPNWYPPDSMGAGKTRNEFLDVGCFGAIRPLKNQLIQALAAIEYANQLNRPLRFHVNARTEQGGEAVLKNLKALLTDTGNQLVIHPWQLREEFLDTLSRVDVSMQVSLSETFDITAADTVALGVPLVTSREVSWSSPICQAQATNTASILAKLHIVTGPKEREIAGRNLDGLRDYSADSEKVWRAFQE